MLETQKNAFFNQKVLCLTKNPQSLLILHILHHHSNNDIIDTPVIVALPRNHHRRNQFLLLGLVESGGVVSVGGEVIEENEASEAAVPVVIRVEVEERVEETRGDEDRVADMGGLWVVDSGTGTGVVKVVVEEGEEAREEVREFSRVLGGKLVSILVYVRLSMLNGGVKSLIHTGYTVSGYPRADMGMVRSCPGRMENILIVVTSIMS